MTHTDVSEYFNDNWKKYQETLKHNTMYHREMSAALNSFINTRVTQPFSFVDVGCGDCSTIAPVLTEKALTQYIGIDAAPDVLKIASQNLHSLSCKKEFICDDMINAISTIPSSVDIIYTSYAIHHLSHDQKFQFIQDCQNKLNKNGYFLMVDGILNENQTRLEWLAALENRIKTTQSLTPEELELRMQHPRKDDFPESIATFEAIAKTQKWQKFEVLVKKEIYAFMVFVK